MLRTWRELQLIEGTPVADDDARVLPNRRPAAASALVVADIQRLASRSGQPVIRLHDLRHTHATMLLKAGVPLKVVSERLGHASPAFTMAVYQHVLPGMQAEAATVFADLIATATRFAAFG